MTLSAKRKTETILKKILKTAFLLCVVAGISTVAGFYMIESTSTHEYCASCHEMEQFHEAWLKGPHGAAGDGALNAECVDCHLPHNSPISYLTEKAKSGARDIWAHTIGKDTDWVATREHRNDYTFDSGCRRCHVELVAPGIPLKAYLAHRDYNIGATEKTCVDCHVDAGHGDLLLMLQKDKSIEERRE